MLVKSGCQVAPQTRGYDAGVPLYEVTNSGMDRYQVAAFAALGLSEREDLQRLLRDDITVLDDDLLVVSEEFGNWEDARRRIDLLAVDSEGHLVVIELKRTEDGGHMDLQALRYAAMVSSMLFDDVAAAFQAFLEKTRPDEDLDARETLASFLDLPEDGEPTISSDVRILLVSANFGREVTTAVLWLNGFDGMDIRCVRLVPYQVDDKVLLDIQQIVPLPEAADYQVRLRRKDQEQKRTRADGRDFTRFHIVVDNEPLNEENKRNAVRTMVEQLMERQCSAEQIAEVLGARKLRGIDGLVVDVAAIAESVQAAYPDLRFDPKRWYVERPFQQAGRTWVLTKMWGLETEQALADLSKRFATSGVGFRRAETD